MASFDEHINQAKSNLKFLTETNSRKNVHWDWQVTVAFYSALHIVNAHLAQAAGLHYRTHEDVKNALNPNRPMSITKVNEEIYLCYVKLEGLSRRARYLCHDDPKNLTTVSHFTYDRHFTKAIRKLDQLLDYFCTFYNISLPSLEISCVDFSSTETMKVFKIVK